MKLVRTVVAKELDSLGPGDPSAMRSRRDLQRVHRAMGTCTILAGELQAVVASRPSGRAPVRVLELGAGDGTLMLRVAHALMPRWPAVQLALLDRVDLLDGTTRAGYAAAGWTATPHTLDALDWARRQDGESTADGSGKPLWDLVVANLFLHHFEAEDLQLLLAAIARRSQAFLACEPRRSGWALAGSHWIGALGAGSVTRADAVTSVHAGFCGQELSALWAPRAGWALAERPAGLFSHCFRAERTARTATEPAATNKRPGHADGV